jgi:hypothetical protein
MQELSGIPRMGDFPEATRRSRASARGRRDDWVRADVRCIACARLLGRLLGAARQLSNGTRGAGQPASFLGFRPIEPPGPIVPYTSDLKFRCAACGGAGVLDDIETFSTYDSAGIDDGPDGSHEE